MLIPNSLFRSRRWSVSTSDAQGAFLRLHALLQTARSDGWANTADLPQLVGCDAATLGALIETCGDKCRPVGYPTAEIERRRTNTDAFSRSSEAPKLRSSEASRNREAQTNGQNQAQTSENQREGGAETGVGEAGETVEKRKCSTQAIEYIYNTSTGREDVGMGVSMGSGDARGEDRRGKGGTVPEWASKLVFATKDAGLVWLSEQAWSALSAAHSETKLRTELPAAALWLHANETKRKTAKGLLRFLAAWMGRERIRRAPTANFSAARGYPAPRREQGVWRVGQ